MAHKVIHIFVLTKDLSFDWGVKFMCEGFWCNVDTFIKAVLLLEEIICSQKSIMLDIRYYLVLRACFMTFYFCKDYYIYIFWF